MQALTYPPTDPSQKDHRPTILIVDDCEDTVELFSMFVEGLCPGYRIVGATNAADGLDRAKALGGRLTLAFVDASMPDHDGFWLVRQMRAEGALAEVPVYLVTGHDRIHLQNIGIKGALVKPVSIPALRAVIETVFKTDLSRFS
jgi:CheY-like chemotaxis protein